MHVSHHGVGSEVGIYARHRHTPRRLAAGIGIIRGGIHVGQIDIVARVHPHTLGQRLRDDDGSGLRQTPQVALDGTERQHVEQRQRYGSRPVIVTVVVVLRTFHPHVFRAVAHLAYCTRTLHLGPRRKGLLGVNARLERYPPVIVSRQQDICTVGVPNRTVVGNIVIHLRHYHIEGQKRQRHARDVQHRSHLVTPQCRNKILECYFHLSNCNFNRFPSSGSHVTRRPVRARGSRLRRASCAA